MKESKPRALILLAPGAEEMETVISADVLRRGGIDVVVAGLDGAGEVECSRGVRMVPDAALSKTEEEKFDAVVLPGGMGGAQRLATSERVGALLKRYVNEKRTVAAICAAPMALVQHGVFEGYRMTCHPAVREIVSTHGKVTDDRVVEDRNLITSQGPGTAFAFALRLVARLAGEEMAAQVRDPMILD